MCYGLTIFHKSLGYFRPAAAYSADILQIAHGLLCSIKATDLIFVEPGVKVDGAYYRNVVLRQQMLPAIEQLAGDVYVFQQARATMEFLRCETPVFIPPDLWPANSPDLNPVDSVSYTHLTLPTNREV